MIEIPFDPNVHFGPITLAWHGIFTAVGIFFGVWLPLRLLRGKINEDDGWAVATWGVVGGIVGARLVHVIDQLPYYLAHPEQVFFIWTGGIAIWGAAIGGVLGGFLAAVRRGVPIGYGADAAAPGLALGFAIGRIGDIINGEHHGSATNLPWGVEYVNQNTLGEPGKVVHPEVAYEMVLCLLVLGALLPFHQRLKARLPSGVLGLIYLGVYAAGRFFLSYLRTDPAVFLSLRQAQLASALMVVIAIIAIPVLFRLARAGAAQAPATPSRV